MRMTMVHHCHSSAVRPSVAGLLGFAAAALLLCSPPARADVTWKATKTGDWSVASNWTGGVPTSGSNADIFNGGTATISRAESCSSLSLGNTAGSGMIELNGGGLTVSNSAFVGLSAREVSPNPPGAAPSAPPPVVSTSATTRRQRRLQPRCGTVVGGE